MSAPTREWQDGEAPPRRVLVEFDTTDSGPHVGYWSGHHFVSAVGEGLWSPRFVIGWRAVAVVPVGDVRREWGYRFRGIVGAESVLHEERAMDEDFARGCYAQLLTRPDWYADVALLRRTVSTSPWVVVSDAE